DELRDGQDLDRLAALRTPGDRRVRGPQVDADDEVLPRCHAPLREGASLIPRRGLREPGMEPGRQLETSPELRPTPSAEAASLVGAPAVSPRRFVASGPLQRKRKYGAWFW